MTGLGDSGKSDPLALTFGLLGPLRIVCADDEVRIGARKPRVLLASLLVEPGTDVAATRLIERLWDDDEPQPRDPRATLRTYVSNLRSTFSQAVPGRTLIEGSIDGRSGSLRIALGPDDELDSSTFDQLVRRAREARRRGNTGDARALLVRALDLWRGDPLSDIGEAPWLGPVIERLVEMRLSAQDDLTDVRIAAGEGAMLVPDLERRAREAPTRERRWGQLAISLYQDDRQTDALRAITRARETLEEYGNPLGEELVALQSAILARDETLLSTAAPNTLLRSLRIADVSGRARVGAAQATHLDRQLNQARSAVVADVLDIREGVRARLAGTLHQADSPYRGLLRYEAKDAPWFHGRDRLIASLVGRLATSSATAILGASGSGKSSLARAGVIPHFVTAAVAGEVRWQPLVLTPTRDPFAALTDALHVLDVTCPTPRWPSTGPVEAWARILDHVDGGVVVLVDQLEELFTTSPRADERAAFIDLLAAAASAELDRLRLLVTLRSDFLDELASVPALAPLTRSSELVGSMSPTELREAIEAPAERAGLRVEPGLSDLVVADTAGQAGALPLVSTALRQTWLRRDGDTLTIEGYRRSGGVAGAVGNLAESLFLALSEDERLGVQTMFLRLVADSRGRQDVRRHVPVAELCPKSAQRQLLARLVEHRLIVIDRGTAEVAHEALLREWPRLSEWLENNRESHRRLRHIAAAADEWDSHGKDPGDLYRGARLQSSLEVVGALPLTEVERSFLDASNAEARSAQQLAEDRAHQQRRQNRRLRRLLAGVAVLTVVAVVAGAVAVSQRATARARARDADYQRLLSQSVDRVESNPSLGLLLALEASRMRDAPASRSALFATLQSQRSFLGYSPTDGVPGSAALTEDSTLAYGTGEGAVGFVDLESGRALGDPVRLGRRPEDGVHVFLAEDPTRSPAHPVVTARADTGQVFRIDPDARRVVGEPLETGGPLFSLASSEQFGLVAAGRADGTVVLFEPGTQTAVATLPAPAAPVDLATTLPEGGGGYGAGDAVVDEGDPVALAFAPDRPELAVERPDGTVEIWDVDQRALLRSVPNKVSTPAYTPNLGELAYRSDGRVLLAIGGAGDGADARILDLGTGKEVPLQTGSQPTAGTFGEHGRVFVAQGSEVVEFDGEDGTPVAFVASTGMGAASALDLDGQGALTVASAYSPVIGRWSVTGRGPVVHPVDTLGRVPADLSPDGRTLLVEKPDGSLEDRYALIDTATDRTTLARLPFTHAAFASDRRLVGGSPDGSSSTGFTGSEWDFRTGTAIPPSHQIPINGYSGEFAVDDGIGLFAIGYEDGTVRFYSRPGSMHPRELHVDGRVRDLAIDGSTGRLLVATTRAMVHLFDLATGREIGRPVPGVAATFRDGRPDRFFVGTRQGALVEIDAATGGQVGRTFPPLPSAIGDISSAGQLLAATDLDGRFRLFDAASHTQLGADLNPPPSGRSVMADDGSFVVLATRSGADVWTLDVEDWRAAACRLAGRNLTREEWRTYLSNSGDHRRTCAQWPSGT